MLIRKPDNILKLQPLIDGIIKHEFDREGMVFFRTKSLTVTSNENVDWTLDGEHAVSDTETQISNIHNAITLLLPHEN